MIILFYVFIVIAICASAIYIAKAYVQYKYNELEWKKKSRNSHFLNLKLQAIERCVLYLERIRPNQLVQRIEANHLSAKEYGLLLVKQIREEFEHNLSQQIYLKNGNWELLKSTKEDLIKVILSEITNMQDTDSAIDLSKSILEKQMENPQDKIQIAIDQLKAEVKETV